MQNSVLLAHLVVLTPTSPPLALFTLGTTTMVRSTTLARAGTGGLLQPAIPRIVTAYTTTVVGYTLAATTIGSTGSLFGALSLPSSAPLPTSTGEIALRPAGAALGA